MADEEVEEVSGLAKYSPSGEVDQYGFPVIPKGKRTPIKVLGSKLSNILRYKEDSQKSKEQLDIEKQNIILSRIVPFEIEGLDYNVSAREPRPFTKSSGISRPTATITNRNSRDRTTT